MPSAITSQSREILRAQTKLAISKGAAGGVKLLRFAGGLAAILVCVRCAKVSLDRLSPFTPN
jgi:hypothetical protein